VTPIIAPLGSMAMSWTCSAAQEKSATNDSAFDGTSKR
jgi:hypothetical protein